MIQVELNKPFKLRFVNKQNVDVEIIGNVDISRLGFELTNSTSYPTPQFKSLGGNKFRIFYNNLIPANSYYEYQFTHYGTEAAAEIVNFWSRLTPFVKKAAKGLAYSGLFLAFGVAGIIADRKLNDGKIADALRNPYEMFTLFKAADIVEEKVDRVESAVFTNKHKAYQSEGAQEVEAALEEDFKRKMPLDSLFWYTGEGVFMLRDVAKDKDGKPGLFTYEKAADFCEEKFRGTVPTAKELEKLGGSVRGAADFIFPMQTNRGVAEWTSTAYEKDNDYLMINLKGQDEMPANIKPVGDMIFGHEGKTKAAFRCVFYAATLMGAE